MGICVTIGSHTFDPALPGTSANPNPAGQFAKGTTGDPVGITLAPDGSLYYISTADNGALVKISYSAVPVITHRPANQTEAVGGSATFVVRATAAASLSYRWQRNDGPGGAFVNIPGATHSALTLADLTAADNGAAVRVVVISSGGRATSKAAKLTVT